MNEELSRQWLVESVKEKYTYNFTWMGRPIIQYPQDIVAMQELIWSVKPDLIIETGIAHGGSLVFYASMMELLGRGTVIGVDIDIRKHNRIAIERHPMYKRITMIEGSSVEEDIFEKVVKFSSGRERIMVVLDSMHTHEHVLKELSMYSSMVSVGSYIVVFDTLIEKMPAGFYKDRPWGIGNNPATAVSEFLNENTNFVQDRAIESTLGITSSEGGFLVRVR